MSRILWAAILASELAVFYRKILLSPSRFAIPYDFREFHFPRVAWIADSLAHGQWPWWDPYTYCGLPLFATIQAQVFYPPTLLTAAISNLFGGGQLLFLLELQALFHILFAGLCACFFLQRIGLGPWPALIGATIFQLGPYFDSQLQHLGAVDAAAWLPAACLCALNLQAGRPLRWTGALALTWAMSLLAGFPSAAAPVLIASGLIALAVGRGARTITALRFGMALVLASAIASIQFIPATQLARQSVARFRADELNNSSGMPLQALASLIAPDFYHIFEPARYVLPWNPTFLYLYCGVPALLLMLYAFIARRPRELAVGRYRLILLLLTVVFGFLMLGSSVPVGSLVMPALLKLTNYAVYAEFMMAGFVFGIACLAALGAAALFKTPWQNALALLVIAADLIYAGSGTMFNTVATLQDTGIGRDQFDGSPALLSRVRAELNGTVPPYRLDTVNDSLAWADGAPLLGIPTSNGDDPMALSNYLRVRSLFSKEVTRSGRYYPVATPDSRWLDYLNVRVLLSRTPIETNGHWRKLADVPGRMLYVNDHVLPRFFFARETLTADSSDAAFQMMRSPGFDPARPRCWRRLSGCRHALTAR